MRLSHLAAMATLVALLGAMFVAMGSAGADGQAHYATLGLDVDFPNDSDNVIAAGSETKVRLRLIATDMSSRVVTDASKAKVDDYSGLRYTFVVANDTGLRWVRASGGAILEADASGGSTAQETGVVFGSAASAQVLAVPPVLVQSKGDADDSTTSAVIETPAPHVLTISDDDLSVIIPAGTTENEITVSAAVIAGVTITLTKYQEDGNDDGDDPDAGDFSVDQSDVIYIPLSHTDADAENNVDHGHAAATPTAANATRSDSSVLAIGNVDEVDSISFGRSSPRRDRSTASGYSSDPGTTEPAFISTAGGTTEFTLHVFNANEKPSQSNSISSIVVSTTAGSMSAATDSTTALVGEGQCGGSSTTCELEPPRATMSPLPTTGLRFLLAAPTRSGTADVRVVVISRAGNVLIDEDQIVTFHGPAAMLEAGEASGTVLGYDVVGTAKGGTDKKAGQDGDTSSDPENPNGDADRGSDKRDQITFKVSAVDKGGTTVVTPRLSARVTGPDDRAVSSDKFVISQTGDLSDTVHLDIDTAASKALKVGEHTIKFSAGSLSGTSSFTVAGTADAMELETSEGEPSEIGETVELTATVTDTDGQPVADGTVVQFNASDKTGDTDAVLIATTTEMPGTMGGVAQVTYVVVGDGSAVVTATVSDDRTPVVRVKVIQSTAGAPEPVVEPEPEPEVASVDCLSNLSGFSTWTCGVDADVSEIFTMVSERGVTAIHLWNGTNWVRYSVVGGSEVPGSSDFMVTKTDILYISQ